MRNQSQQHLSILLRLMGSASLFAILFIMAPYSWMDEIHQGLGMGRLPDEPVVGYLARSTSAFYAILGGLLWVVSFDLPRFRPILIYLGITITVFGVMLGIVDWVERLPKFWAYWEGPFVTIFGLVVLVFSLRSIPNNEQTGD